MAEKLPVIIDNRGDNTVVNALRRLLPNLQKADAATDFLKMGLFLLRSFRDSLGMRLLLVMKLAVVDLFVSGGMRVWQTAQ